MKKTVCGILVCALLLLCAACSSDSPQNYIFSAEDLLGKTVGALEHTAAAGYIDRSEEISAAVTRSSAGELMEALKSGSIDCAVVDAADAKKTMRGVSGVKMLDTYYIDSPYSFVVAKENIALTEDINKALEKLLDDGTLAKIADRYINGGDYVYESTLDPETCIGTLTLVADASFYPYCYVGEDDSFTGLDVDVARAVCDILQVDLEIIDTPHDKCMDNVIWGNADFTLGQFSWNETDGERVDFSDAYYTSQQAIIIRK